MANASAERDKRLLRLSVGKGLIDEATAKRAYHTAQSRQASVVTVLVEEGHLTAQLASRLGDEAERAAGPKRIAGFVVERKLGQGGMGAVYLARQESIDRPVALKVLSPRVVDQPGIAERFVREARAAGRVNHPNVVAIHDAGTHQGCVFMALEFVPGGDAEGLMKAAGGRLGEARALRVAADAARGLQAVHAVGLIHRDIKPANIFIAADGTAKLGDLGLARAEDGDDRMTATGAAVGTPAFMSPEQANGDPRIDIRSDIYALGATLYALVVGEPPYTGSTVWNVVDQVLNAPPPDPRKRGVGEAVSRIIQRAMAKDPALRQQDPQELLDALMAAQTGQPVAVAPIRALARPTRPLAKAPAGRRVRWWWAAGAAAALLLIGMIARSVGAPAGTADPRPAPPSGPSVQLVVQAAAPAPQTWLADLVPTTIESIPPDQAGGAEWGFGIGRFGSRGVPITVRGQRYPRGLAIHPPADATPARLTYDLDGTWRRFSAQVGINDTSDVLVQGRRGSHSPLVFVVVGDGRELWRSPPVATGDPPQPFEVAVTGVRRLELRVEIAGVFHCCQAVWLDPKLVG